MLCCAVQACVDQRLCKFAVSIQALVSHVSEDIVIGYDKMCILLIGGSAESMKAGTIADVSSS